MKGDSVPEGEPALEDAGAKGTFSFGNGAWLDGLQ